jgi:hypothetical protein
MNSLNQAETEFSKMTAMRAAENTRAKAGFALLGTNRIVGHLRLHTSSKEGKSAEVSDGGGTEMEIAGTHFC